MKKSKRKKYANPLAPIHPQVTPKTGKPAPGFAPDAARSRHRALAPRHSQPISTKSEKGIRARRAGDPTRHLRDPQTFSSFTRHRASPPPAPLPLPRPHLLPPAASWAKQAPFLALGSDFPPPSCTRTNSSLEPSRCGAPPSSRSQREPPGGPPRS